MESDGFAPPLSMQVTGGSAPWDLSVLGNRYGPLQGVGQPHILGRQVRQHRVELGEGRPTFMAGFGVWA
ncbi:hypothetical protein GCM10022419_065430 [Nonomuraea rosea]|uniref:Uncharacterized protein n=1 Tax=Nonomuraea rosea TaxID=638574 RepID=A0ABP6Y1Z5_9ACTN